MQDLSQRGIVGEPDVGKSLIEAGNGAAIHFIMLSVATMNLDDSGLVSIGSGIRAGATECFSPVSGESLDMIRLKAVAEGMRDYFVGQHAMMPGFGEMAHAVHSTRRLEDSLHAFLILHPSIMTSRLYLCKRMGAAVGQFEMEAIQTRDCLSQEARRLARIAQVPSPFSSEQALRCAT
jgi:hypothetical protein